MSDQQQMIALRDYSFTYAMGIKPALRHISLEIQEGGFYRPLRCVRQWKKHFARSAEAGYYPLWGLRRGD